MNIKVAIVEDEAEIRAYFQALIQGFEGYTCVGAYETGEYAIEQIPALKPDVVLMDIHLPGISGIETIAILKSLIPETQFVVCTSYEDADSVFNALKVGAMGYLTKSVQPAKLIDAILDVYQGGSPMSSHIARKVLEAFSLKIQPNHHFQHLSRREQEILQQLSKGLRYQEIADQLFVSLETVRTHIRNCYEKLQVNSRVEALKKTGLL
jgi:DNA-binding NarL/FixJ family response regulator